MYHVTIHFDFLDAPLDDRYITGRGLHGLLYKALSEVEPGETEWLHNHQAPKPYSLAPVRDDGGHLARLRIGTVSPRVADLVVHAWDWHRKQDQVQTIGRQQFRVVEVSCVAGPGWADLVDAQPAVRVDVTFLSPTTFRQGPGHMPLPVPYNVFYWPWRVWQTYAPPVDFSDDWLDWCKDEVFITDYHLETAPARIIGNTQLKGFVGWARFETKKGTLHQLRLFHALAKLASYSGVGYKTTMGLGAVDMRATGLVDSTYEEVHE